MFNRQKFVAVVHYICHKAAGDPSCLGAVKLNKVLWYSDVFRYVVSGSPITGEQYIKRQHGPVPRHVEGALQELVESNRLVRGKVDFFGFKKSEYHSLVEPDLSQLSAAEIAQIDDAFDHVCHDHTAKSISEETHGVIWQLAEMGEAIPYSAVLASEDGEITEDDLAWAYQALAAQGYYPAAPSTVVAP